MQTEASVRLLSLPAAGPLWAGILGLYSYLLQAGDKMEPCKIGIRWEIYTFCGEDENCFVGEGKMF